MGRRNERKRKERERTGEWERYMVGHVSARGGEVGWGVLDRRRGEGKNGKEEREEKKRKREDRRMGKVYGRTREHEGRRGGKGNTKEGRKMKEWEREGSREH
jgi:hypothetical protein